MKLPKALTDIHEWLIIGPLGPEPSDELKKLPVLAVDGGGNFCKSPTVWIGDSDSILSPPSSEHIFQLSTDKDASDFAYALKLLAGTGSKTLHLWGLSGGRLDHELFTIGEALHFLEDQSGSRMISYSQSGRINGHFLSEGTWDFDHQGLFSLASFRKNRIKLLGDVEYPLTNTTWLHPFSSLGLSNEARGKVQIQTNGPIMVYFPETK